MGQIVKVYKDGVGYQVLNTNNIGDALEAGDNISINGNEISAVDTTYSAGTGLSLSGTTFSLNIDYGADLSLSIDPSTFVLTAQLKDQNGSNIGSAQTIDLPLESVVVSGTYNAQTKEVELTLQSGSVIRFSVADLVSGLQEELIVGEGINIDANNEISVDTSVIATKEYVDDSISEFVSSGPTAPSNPTQGMLRYDTVNDVLKSYDGSNWNEVGNESADINTKTFHLSGTSDLTNAQAAYDWFSAGKNPIVMYNNRAYLLYAKNATQLIFQDIENSAYNQNSYTEYVGQKIIFTLSGNDVTAINYNSTSGWSGPILRTDVDYPTPYTPTYEGSPATKQYVDNNDTYTGASAPTDNVVEGRLWYDTTNDVLKVYDGSGWVDTGKIYTAGDHINISDTDIISTTGLQEELTAGENITIQNVCTAENDTKGPCPNGFHIPTGSEWGSIINNFTILGILSVDNFTGYLKLPLCGQRFRTWSARVGSAGEYRASTKGLYNKRGDCLAIYGPTIHPYNTVTTSNNNTMTGLCIRPFKNTPTAPDNTWTMLYDGSTIASGSGIFWNESLGLISISSDGSTWDTITDKNLGATQVRNTGDTITSSNCGGYFQRGNSYMFPFSGNISDNSNDRVDASEYGPGNYYSSSTWINDNYSGTETRDTSNNPNLRGGQTQGTWQYCRTEISSIDTDTKYTAGTGINIDANNVISATATPGQTYTAGNGINIDQNNEISVDTTVVATQTDLATKQDTLTAGENTSIENICESDMQGPCPSGFHVPTVGEWNGLINIMKNALSLQYGPDWMGYLHMPLAGQRDCESSDVEYQREEGFYVTSIFDDATPSFSGAFFLLVRPGDTVYVEEYGLPVAIGLSIRGFKNEYITPTSSWTVVQGTLGSAGIFRDQTNGLISITDGTTGYTMMDKNLGATTVWNTGDTLSEANCGKYYQWGNNYGFPRSGSITTSSTQVDASGYGPGNYYSSSTFITTSTSPFDWSSAENKNLRGGVSQGTWCRLTISAEDTKYSAGTGINIDANNVISATATPGQTYTAGNGINISQNNEISADTSVVATKTDVGGMVSKGSNETDSILFSITNPDASPQTTTAFGPDGVICGNNNGLFLTSVEVNKVSVTDSLGKSSELGSNRLALYDSNNMAQTTFIENGITVNNTVGSISETYQFSGGGNNQIARLKDVKTYTAGTGINISQNNEISADTTVLATKQDIANLGSFEVVASLPSVDTADTKTIYLLGPIGTGADKYEERIVTGTEGTLLAFDYPGGIDWQYMPNTITFNEPTTLTFVSKTGDGRIEFNLIDSEDYYQIAYCDAGEALLFPNGAEGWYYGSNIDEGPAEYVDSSSCTFPAGTYQVEVYCSYQDPYDTIIFTTGTPKTWTKIGETSIDLSGYATTSDLTTGLATKQNTLTASTGINIDSSNNISNTLPGPTIAATAPTGTEGALWYDTTNNVLMAHDGTSWKEAGTQMKVLSYGHSTWQDFIDAYNENAIVYCRASSNSNPGSGNQGRMAFMAFVSINNTTGLPTEVEFQYYRSRSDHNTAANQLDQVFVYKLTSASGGTWTVTERNTGAKAVAGTGINLAFGSGNMTISADTTTLATKTDLNSKQDTLVSGTNIKSINNESLLGTGNITIPIAEIGLSTATGNLLTSGAKIWVGDESDLPTTPNSNTVYLCAEQTSGTPRLPAAYQEVEYIESGTNGGTQYINFKMPYYDSEGYYSFEIDAGNVGNAEGILLTVKQALSA